MGSWIDLPDNILEIISEKLSHSDLLEVGVVCKSWRSTYLKLCSRLPKNVPLSMCHPRPFGVPLLLLSCEEGSISRKYTALNNANLHGEIFLPETANKWICGSSCGWLITTDIYGQEVALLNPVTRVQIKLPSLATFTKRMNPEGMPDDAELDCFEYIYKAVISHDPVKSQQECIVMAIVGNMCQLSFCKIGDDKWTNVDGSPLTLEDVIYSEGRFYTVTQFGVVVSCDGKNPNSKGMTVVAESPGPRYHYTKKYLVVSFGRLLQVCRTFESKCEFHEDDSLRDESIETKKFDIFELVKRKSPIITNDVFPNDWIRFQREEEIWHNWILVEDLEDQVLLLGNNASLSLQSGMYDNCKSNCIHFTDDHFDRHVGHILGHNKRPLEVHHDIGTFDITERSIRNDHPNDMHNAIPSIWLMPNPW